MKKKIALIICYFLFLVDKIFYIFGGKNFSLYVKDHLDFRSYKKIKFGKHELKFFTPSKISEWRVNTLFEKEPDTIQWIDNFKSNNNEIIFWDIGSNIGIFSLYAAKIYQNCKIYSFEPSTSNLRILSRNVDINNFNKKIKIMNLPLGNINNKFLNFKETHFQEGAALNTFGTNYNFEGKQFLPEINYELMGITIDHLLEKKIIEKPNYIKIDVDGTEHLILEGAKKALKSSSIKSILIEVNKNFKSQHLSILKTMKKNNFKISLNEKSISYSSNDQFFYTNNYIFNKKKI
tara:strand:+ start:3631 stop:4503 length:873 start_codon:yes stop_codon:yes gene_type:complete